MDLQPLSRKRLFPLNRPDGLGGEVVEDAIDAGDLFCNPVGQKVQKGIGNFLDGRGHGVGRVDGAENCRPALITLAVLDAGALHVGHGDKILPDLACQAVFIEFLTQNGVGFPQRLEPVAGDGAQAPHAEARTRERLAVDHAFRQAQRIADDADLVFVKELERLDKGEAQLGGQAADVVVRLDALFAFEDVGVDGALRQEFDAVELLRLLLKDLDEFRADDFALGLGVADARKLVQKAVRRVDVDEICIHFVAENADDLLGLALAQKPVVDVDAHKLLANGLD